MPDEYVDDAEYAEDVAADDQISEPLPEPTDPSTIPADQGDANAANKVLE